MTGHWWRHTVIVLAAGTLFMAAAALANWPWWEFAFRSDMSPVSWLSSALLLANAAVTVSLTLCSALPRALGTTLSATLALLALDEEFQLHERLQDSFIAGRFGHAPTVAVGIGGIIAAVALIRTIRPPAARGLIASGVALGLFAIWVDLGSPPAVIGALEESFEVIAESLFLSGLLELSRSQVQSTP
jgi:hypothetical protein